MHGLMMNYPLTMDRILEHARALYSNAEVATKTLDGSWHRYTYGDMYVRVKQLANALKKLGVTTGDRVATFSWNNYQHLELYYAIPCHGAVCHTLNIRLPPDQLSYIINHAEDKVIFIDASLWPLFQKIVDQCRDVAHFVFFNCAPDQIPMDGGLHYETLIEAEDDNYQWPVKDEQTAMGLCYTSGTTGNPKGVLYSHRSMYLHTMGENQANSLALTSNDIVLPVVPQFHAMAWGLPYACCMAGAGLVMPGPFLQGEPLAEMIADERVTVAAGVPTIWNGLYGELSSNPRDTSSVRCLVVGGSAMPRSLIEAYEANLNIPVLHAWGMTELSPLGTNCLLGPQHASLSREKQWDVKATQGYPIGGVELRIMDDEGNEVPWDGKSPGELQARGPWVAGSYYKLEQSEDSFTADGWFRTGDVASIDSSGYMKIGDRTKDLVKSGGEWISSVDLENAIMAHPSVKEASVIAIPDDKWAERPLAAVVRADGVDEIEIEELRRHLATDFAKFQIPDTFVFIDEVPKTSVGKFDKKVLRRMYAEGKLG